MNPEFSQHQTPPDIIEVGAGEVLMAEELEVVVATVATTDTIVALYDPQTGVGFMGRYANPEAENHDIQNLLVSAKNISPAPAGLYAWAIDVETDPTREDPLVVALDCRSGLFSVDGKLLEPTRIF